jgi:Family of unknown function (DUF6600)
MPRLSRLAVLFASAALVCAAASCGKHDTSAPAQPEASAPAQSDTSAHAQSAAQPDPSSRVARLSQLRGEVSLAPAGENDWAKAELNRPLVTGDKLWTQSNARAELQLGSATAWIDQQTSFDFLKLDEHSAQMELTQGSLDLAVHRLGNGESDEVDTPTLAFIAKDAGDYRIDVDPKGTLTTVTVRRGSGDIYGEGGANVHIKAGQSLSFDNPALRDSRTVAQHTDDFDRFVAESDGGCLQSESRQYVNNDVVGCECLEKYGSWHEERHYGRVWYPEVAVGWAPYRYGHWVWIEPWGWTWVGDEPWGFAPYHYGRWAYVDSRWGWVPGPVGVYPVYAPALVAFVGGNGFGISFSYGGPVGWFPLAPGEVYFPSYWTSGGYFAALNISNTTINRSVVNNYYGALASNSVNMAQMNFANRRVAGATTAVPANTFASARPVAHSMVPANSADLRNARVMSRAAVTPTQSSVLGAGGRAAAAPASAMNRSVVATRSPPATPASFAERSAMLQRTPGQPLSAAQASTLAAQRQPQQGAASNVRLATSSTAAVAQDRASATGPAPSERSAHTLPGRVDTGAPGSAVHGAPLPSSTYAHAGMAQQSGRGVGTSATQGDATRTPQVADLQQGRSGRGVTQSTSSSPPASSRVAHAPVQHGGPTTSHSSYAHGGRTTNPNRGYASPNGTAPSSAQGHMAGNSHAPPAMHEGPQFARSPSQHAVAAPAYRGYGPPQGQRGPNASRQIARQGAGKQKGGDNGGPPH